MGDPRGIGPEIAVAATQRVRDEYDVAFTFLGSDQPNVSIQVAGKLAGEAITKAVELAMKGEVDGIVTAPIDKFALHAGGYDYPGHTEMLAALTNTPAVAMMMAAEQTSIGGPLRVVLATTHLPLSRVPSTISTRLLIDQALITHEALTCQWKIEKPRLALCAFNPHASDNGLFGDEEARIMEPAVESLRASEVNISGPIPADTVFIRAIRGEFDAVIAPYHDVGMAAFKTAAFGQGVNVTLGLPFTRTSPDHGTAIDIAGKGVADSSSMVEAIRLAIRLASGKVAGKQV
ncbi:MAG TPA: 4-hydroxythreonine-4-phosphate dehydrogenase PdxA [Longimicrobiales bacterium]|nr:4-hydroxythreonine-4-phosphate dehydrogenase PdxA [Longimicrobiales bacterium]